MLHAHHSIAKLTCTAALAIVVSLAAGAHAAEARLLVGIADNGARMFTSPLFKRAHFNSARDQVPWNVAITRDKTGAVGIWIDSAILDHVTPMISFTAAPGKASGRAPKLAQYRRAVRAFTDTFPVVKVYSAWNEPDFIYNVLARHPKLAAGYYNTLVSVCHGCTVVAGDVYRPATDGLARWVKRYARYLKSAPKAWALHPYDDVRGHTTAAIRAFERVTRGPIWLDEIAGVERRQKWPFSNQSPARANRDERFLFSLPTRFGRIRRIYHYQWQADAAATWDSALLNQGGKPRPAYWTVFDAIRGRR